MTEIIIARCMARSLRLLNDRQWLVTFSIGLVRSCQLQIGKPSVIGNIPNRAAMSPIGSTKPTCLQSSARSVGKVKADTGPAVGRAFARQQDIRNRPRYLGGLFHRLVSSRSCWLASVRHAASIRCKASFVSSSSARSARKAQSAALSRKISAKLIPARWIATASSQRD
jgi:hypothetical protein